MLTGGQYITEAGKLTTERRKTRDKKKQVVETTCESHEKTSRDSCNKPGKLPLRKPFPETEIS